MRSLIIGVRSGGVVITHSKDEGNYRRVTPGRARQYAALLIAMAEAAEASKQLDGAPGQGEADRK